MCSTTDDGPRFRAEHRSVQMALLDVQQVIAGDPFRPISGVHYLYCLCVARRHRAGIAELGRELAGDPRVELAVRGRDRALRPGAGAARGARGLPAARSRGLSEETSRSAGTGSRDRATADS